jgi:predicted alpha/beta-fold hydrolase
MDVPVKGWNIFHAARLSDAHETAMALRHAMEPNQMLAAVGYSMGSIVLNNYVATYGADCPLDAAFSISGALDCRYEADFERPKRVWQPMIAEFMRLRHLSKWGERMKKRLRKEDFLGMLQSTTVIDIDRYITVAYYGFPSLRSYYADMSAVGDIPSADLESATYVGDHKISGIPRNARILNVSVPLCILHALDDPISTWRNNAAGEGFLRPDVITGSGKGNIMLLLTQKGGHVGWPTGWLSWRNGWEFMNEAAASFVDAIEQAKLEQEWQTKPEAKEFPLAEDCSRHERDTNEEAETPTASNHQSRLECLANRTGVKHLLNYTHDLLQEAVQQLANAASNVVAGVNDGDLREEVVDRMVRFGKAFAACSRPRAR